MGRRASAGDNIYARVSIQSTALRDLLKQGWATLLV